MLQRSLMVNAYYRNKGDITNCTFTWWIFGIWRLQNIYRYHPIALCVILCLFIWCVCIVCDSGMVRSCLCERLGFLTKNSIPAFIFEFHIQTTSISTSAFGAYRTSISLDISHKSIHVLQRSLMVNAYYRNKGDITNCTFTWWIFGIWRLQNIYRYHPIALCVILCLFIWCVFCV